jgi:adenosylcobyric acid synthase
VVIEQPKQIFENPGNQAAVGVIRLPHISNFNDIDPLSAIDGLTVCFLEKIQELSHFNAVILPGSKNTRFDLNWLHSTGWVKLIKEYAAQGGHVMGICGGYQMMGNYVHDPDGLEGTPGKSDGLRLLPVETYLKAPKTTTLTRFSFGDITGSGYEIHMGHTNRSGGEPLFQVAERNNTPCEDEDGCLDPDSGNMGTYIHGLFETPAITAFWLQHIGLENLPASDLGGLDARNREYELLVEHFEKHINVAEMVETVLGSPLRLSGFGGQAGCKGSK